MCEHDTNCTEIEVWNSGLEYEFDLTGNLTYESLSQQSKTVHNDNKYMFIHVADFSGLVRLQ